VLGQFARLVQNSTLDVAEKLSTLQWLEAEELFYVGFHFAEQNHRAREFGQRVLELAIQRAPKTEVAKNARRKLKTEGLG
jgi:hypothetical protein